MKKYIFSIIAVIIALNLQAQVADSTVAPAKRNYFGVALGLSASTNGPGANVAIALNKRLAFRLGYEYLDYKANAFNYDQGDVSFSAVPTIKTGGLSAIIDFYIFKGLYIAGGAVFHKFNPSAIIKSNDPLTIGSIEYYPDELGNITIAIKGQNKTAPYLGVGFGRNISRDKKFCMSFELGAYHMGSYVLDVNGTKFFEGNNNNESIDNLNNVLKDISWSGLYPVIKIGLSYKFFEK